jgi:rhodanese-related sulfurtransferase
MKRIPLMALLLVACLATSLYALNIPTADSVPRMSIQDLKQRMDDPNVIIVDVRTVHDWAESATKIKGAIREDPSRISSWMAKYPPSKTIVFYCA